MRCSFDQKEYCPLENVNKGTSQWQLTMPTMFPNGEVPFSNPMTGRPHPNKAGSIHSIHSIFTKLIRNFRW